MNPDGTINENGGPFAGHGPRGGQEGVADRLDAEGLLGEGANTRQGRAHCDRCGGRDRAVLSEQCGAPCRSWQGRHRGVEDGEITVYPIPGVGDHPLAGNIHDWNVSRQMWGDTHPRWYGPRGRSSPAKSQPAKASSRKKTSG